MKNNKNDYFSLDGLAFQINGSDIARNISIETAIGVVADYCAGRERADAAERALCFLADHMPKIEPFCRQIRQTYHLDDFEDAEMKAAVCDAAFNSIVCRWRNRPLNERAK